MGLASRQGGTRPKKPFENEKGTEADKKQRQKESEGQREYIPEATAQCRMPRPSL
jgi:hypothetical protein